MNELIFLSRDCKIALADAEKALSLGTDSEIYTIAGSVNSGCGNLDKGINLNKKALSLNFKIGTLASEQTEDNLVRDKGGKPWPEATKETQETKSSSDNIVIIKKPKLIV